MIADPSRELTARAVLAGCAIGSMLAVGNTYLGLKTGWWDPSSITSVLLSFAFFRAVGRVMPSARGYSILENNVTQTTATAAAAMPSAIGFLGAIPALELGGRRFEAVALAGWGAAIAAFGVLAAALLRDRFVVAKPLPFPSGSAIAEVMRALHARGGDALRRTRTLVASGGVTMLVAWLRDGRPSVVPSDVFLPGAVRGLGCQSLTLGFNVSPMLLSIGMMIGPLLGASLFVGSIVAWAVVAPALVDAHVVASAEYGALVSWLLWPGVALMISGALGPLVADWKILARGLAELGAIVRGSPGAGRDRRSLLFGAIAALAAVGFAHRVFGVHVVLGLVALPVSLALTVVACHAAGETGIAPIASVGQITQLAAGIAWPVSAAADVGCGAIASGCAAQAASSLDVLKAGHLVHASPRRQIAALLAGSAAGCVVSVPAYALVTRAYGVGTPALPAPFALSWKVVAELAATGAAAIPPHAGAAAAIAFAVGLALSRLQRGRFARCALSPMALGVAFMVPAGVPLTMALGAAIVAIVRPSRPAWIENHVPALASGAIGGEAIVGVTIAALKLAGVLG